MFGLVLFDCFVNFDAVYAEIKVTFITAPAFQIMLPEVGQIISAWTLILHVTTPAIIFTVGPLFQLVTMTWHCLNLFKINVLIIFLWEISQQVSLRFCE